MFFSIVAGQADREAEEAPQRQVELDPSRWVELHGDALFRYAVSRIRDRDAAENAVQETFLAALEGVERFAGRSSERTWLMGILKHKIVDRFRRSSRRVEVEDVEALADKVEQESFDEKGRWRTPPTRWSAAPDASLETSQLFEALERCLDGLPLRLSRAFSLREMDELSTAEICKIMDITATNLGVMMHRARMQLRRCLELGWFAPADQAEGSC